MAATNLKTIFIITIIIIIVIITIFLVDKKENHYMLKFFKSLLDQGKKLKINKHTKISKDKDGNLSYESDLTLTNIDN